MILNAVLAVSLAIGMAMNDTLSKRRIRWARAAVAGLVALQTLVLVIVGPLALVEVYLYGKKKGAWYHLRNPTKPRPQYQRPDDLPPVAPRMPVPSFLEDHPPQPRPRTRLFESSPPSEPVSRASILLAVARRFETSGRMGAATEVYRQVLDRFTDTPEAQDAASRLRSLSE
jgi:hypothetical protein